MSRHPPFLVRSLAAASSLRLPVVLLLAGVALAQTPPPLIVADEAAFFSALDFPAANEAVAAKNWGAAKAAWAAHLVSRDQPLWLWSRRDKAAIMALYREQLGDMEKIFGPRADRLLARNFDLQGVKRTLNHDPRKWPVGQNEWTHSLHRLEAWRDLGRAWWATGDAKYAEDFAYLLRGWIAANPPPPEVEKSWSVSGTTWRTLETGIRAATLLDTMELFMDASSFDADAKYLMTRLLMEHGRRLYARNAGFHQGNWQVVECTGLAELGIMFPEFREAAAWRERAFAQLAAHMEKDVYPDGMHWETVPNYHRWVASEFLATARLAKINGYDVPGLTARHEKMYEALMRLARPDGRVPALGDSNNGGLIADSMAAGALAYGRADFRALAPNPVDPEWTWTFGADVKARYATLKSQAPDPASWLLPNSQYAVMRTGWGVSDLYCLFDAAPWGGGHCHQDRLQVLLYAGRDLLVDSGQYSYDQPLAGKFRAAPAHNVLTIDGDKQIEADPKILAWHPTPAADFVSASITDPKTGLSQQRSVFFVRPDYFVIVDDLTGPGDHRLTRWFHFPVATPLDATAESVTTSFPTGANVFLQILDDGKLSVTSDWLPTGLATATRAPVAKIESAAKFPTALVTVLVPLAPGHAKPRIERIKAVNPLVVKLKLTFPNCRVDDVAIAWESRLLHVNEKPFASAHAVCVSSGPSPKTIVIP